MNLLFDKVCPCRVDTAKKGTNMKEVVKYGLVALIIILALVWIVQGNEFFLFKVFAPQYEQVRRETFEQTKSYNQGMIQELQNMRFQYVQADAEHKAALANIILHRAADYPDDKLPPDLRSRDLHLPMERCARQTRFPVQIHRFRRALRHPVYQSAKNRGGESPNRLRHSSPSRPERTLLARFG